jgi:hypothetical protein
MKIQKWTFRGKSRPTKGLSMLKVKLVIIRHDFRLSGKSFFLSVFLFKGYKRLGKHFIANVLAWDTHTNSELPNGLLKHFSILSGSWGPQAKWMPTQINGNRSKPKSTFSKTRQTCKTQYSLFWLFFFFLPLLGIEPLFMLGNTTTELHFRTD